MRRESEGGAVVLGQEVAGDGKRRRRRRRRRKKRRKRRKEVRKGREGETRVVGQDVADGAEWKERSEEMKKGAVESAVAVDQGVMDGVEERKKREREMKGGVGKGKEEEKGGEKRVVQVNSIIELGEKLREEGGLMGEWKEYDIEIVDVDMRAERPVMEIWERNVDKIFKALLDSGSEVTICSLGFAMKNGMKIEENWVGSKIPRKIKGASLAETDVKGIARWDIVISKTSPIFRTRVLVVDWALERPILGANFMAALESRFLEKKAEAVKRRPEKVKMRRQMRNQRKRLYCPVSAFPVAVADEAEDGEKAGPHVVEHEAWIPEKTLSRGKDHVVEWLEGWFQPSVPIVAAAVVRAKVDWSRDGLRKTKTNALRRVRFPVQTVQALKMQNKKSGNFTPVESGVECGYFCSGKGDFDVQVVTLEEEEEENKVEEVIEAMLAEKHSALRSEQEKKEAIEMIRNSGYVFKEELNQAGGLLDVEMKLRVKEKVKPVAIRSRPRTLEEEKFVEQQVRKWLETGVVVRSNSPWSSPIVVAKHPRTGKLRLCLDYRAVNRVLKSEPWPLPLQNEMLASLAQASVATFLDLASAFHQLGVEEASRKYTAFRSKFGNLEFTAAPFGLKSTPCIFQRHMDKIFDGMIWSCVLVYIDDLVIYSRSVEEHIEQVRIVLQILKENRVVLRASKAHFCVTKGIYLGRVIDLENHTIEVLQDAIRPLQSVKVPANKKEVQQFLGLAHRFGEHLPMLAETASPLYDVLKKEGKWDEGKIATAVAKIKSQLLSPAVLRIPNIEQPFVVFVDASEVAICLILAQGEIEWEEVDLRGNLKEKAFKNLHLVGFYNKSLKHTQRKWSIPMKELFALHYFTKKKLYSMLGGGGPHVVVVDAPGSAGLLTARMENREMVRWASELAHFNFRVCKVGSKLQWADAGTRAPFVTGSLVESDKLENPFMEVEGWRKAIEKEEEWRAKKQEKLSGKAVAIAVEQGIVEEIVEPSLVNAIDEVEEEKMCWPWLDITVAEFREQQKEEFGEILDEAIVRGVEIGVGLTSIVLSNGLLAVLSVTQGKHLEKKLLVPRRFREVLLTKSHGNSEASLHLGIGVEQMVYSIGRKFFWKSLKKDVKEFYGKCEICARANVRRKRLGLIHHIEVEKPFRRLCMDLLPMPKVMDEGRWFEKVLVVVCDFSLFTWLIPVPSPCTVETVARYFERRMVEDIVGEPELLWSDADPVFTARYWKELGDSLMASTKCAFGGHQQANGLVESRIGVIKNMLTKILDEIGTVEAWLEVMPYLVAGLRNTAMSQTGFSPNYIVSGWERTDLPLEFSDLERKAESNLAEKVMERRKIWKVVKKVVNEARKKQVQKANEKRADVRLLKGDYVFLKKSRGNFHLEPQWKGCGKIELVLSETSYVVRHGESIRVYHLDDLKRMSIGTSKLLEGIDDGEFEVSKLRDRKVVDDEVWFLVEWKNYHEKKDFTWELREELMNNASELVQLFEKWRGERNGEEQQQLRDASLVNNDSDYVQVVEAIEEVEIQQSSRRVKELRKECQKKGIPKSGSKKKLLERLRNQESQSSSSGSHVDCWWNELVTNAGYAFGYWEINRIPAATLEGITFTPGDRVRVVWFWIPLSEVLKRKGNIELREIGSELFCQFDPVRQVFFAPQFSSGLVTQPWA